VRGLGTSLLSCSAPRLMTGCATSGTLFLQAINPYYLYRFFTSGVSADLAWRSTASIFLCLTGAEASYADMGHFTRKSIRVSPLMLKHAKTLPRVVQCSCCAVKHMSVLSYREAQCISSSGFSFINTKRHSIFFCLFSVLSSDVELLWASVICMHCNIRPISSQK